MSKGKHVPAWKCEEWRRKSRKGWMSTFLADDEEVNSSTIRYHVNGRCSCVTDVDPVTENGEQSDAEGQR